MTPAPKLAIVLIARDQAWNVHRLVASALAAQAVAGPLEVILVDSASSDGTAELAAAHPVEVVRVAAADGALLTPAAGRYVGTGRSRAPLILFLDGDMELLPGWLEHALALMRDDASAAVVTGRVIDLPIDGPAWDDGAPAGEPAVVPVEQGGGAALYRRAVLDEVGTFDPWLHAEEEPELCWRIRRRGYRVLSIDAPMALHRTLPPATVRSVLARRRRGLYLGSGQVARRLAGTEHLASFMRERSFILVSVAVMALGPLAAVHDLSARRATGLRAWAVLLALLAARDLARSRSSRGALYQLARRVAVAEGFVRGWFSQRGEPGAFPMTVRVTGAPRRAPARPGAP